MNIEGPPRVPQYIFIYCLIGSPFKVKTLETKGGVPFFLRALTYPIHPPKTPPLPFNHPEPASFYVDLRLGELNKGGRGRKTALASMRASARNPQNQDFGHCDRSGPWLGGVNGWEGKVRREDLVHDEHEVKNYSLPSEVSNHLQLLIGHGGIKC